MTYKVIDAKDGIVEKFQYEGDTFKSVEGREPKVGDYLVITDKESARILEDVTVGKPYLIERIDGDDDYEFTDDVGDRRYPAKSNYSHAIYEKIESPKKRLIYRDADGVTHTVLDAELIAYSSVEEDE
ncbi:hypothetical protein J26TS2_00320 [Shouchella clausii]|nr:hypothetical protein J26TS2_00320 [Shouchella clausii]